MTTDTYPTDDSAPLAELFDTDGEPDLDDAVTAVGRRIRTARESAGIDAGDLASRLGVQVSTVDAWESGAETLSGHRLARVAGLLGVSLSWILVGHGVEPTDRDHAVSEMRAALIHARTQLNGTLEELEARLDVLVGD